MSPLLQTTTLELVNQFNRLETSEEFYQSLGLSYQVVGIVSGALSMTLSSCEWTDPVERNY